MSGVNRLINNVNRIKNAGNQKSQQAMLQNANNVAKEVKKIETKVKYAVEKK